MNLFSSLLSLFMVGFLWACTSEERDEKAQQESILVEEHRVGYSPDRHGCNASVGETWSELYQTCLRIFDCGIRLNPVENSQGEAVLSAFVLFSSDSTKVELFLPSQEPSLILVLTSRGIFQDNEYQYDAFTQTFSQRGNPLYKGE